jgi:putative ABC transport system substrate-binding protein
VAKKATTSIPIVFANAGDPVGTGLVASLARPGGNVTGLASLSTELITKRLEILKEAVPRLTRVGFFREPASSTSPQLKELRPASSALKVKLEEIDTQVDAKGLESAFQTAKQRQVNGIIRSPVATFSRKKAHVEHGRYRLSAIYFQKNLSMRAVYVLWGRLR